MPVNEILQFAYLTNANIISTPEYQAASWRPGGFVQGVAISPHLNKVWHQASFMAASLGEFIMNATGDDVRDNSDTAGMANRIASAVRATGGGGGPSGPIGVPNAPGMDNTTYGLRNQNWVPVVSQGDLYTILAGYLPLSGGVMSGFITLNAEPQQAMHPVNQGYLERRLTEISVGGGGGIPEAPSPGPYGRGGLTWIPLDGRYLRADAPIGPALRIEGNEPAGPGLELRQLAVANEDEGGLWRIYVGSAGNWNVERHSVAASGGTHGPWEPEISIGWRSQGFFVPRGGIVTGVGVTDFDPVPGSFQAFAYAPVGLPGNAAFPEVIFSNTGAIAGPYSEPYPRYGRWRIAVGGNANMVFQHNTTWAGDFSDYIQALILRPDYSVEVYGSLQVDNDITLGRMTVGDSWILRPNVGGYRNLNIGVAGAFPLDNFTIYSNWSLFTGNLLTNGPFTAYQGAHIQGNYAGNPLGLYVDGGTEFRGNTYFHSWANEFWPPPGGSDPIQVRAHYPGYARINYDVPGTAQWTCGVANTGQWMLACESSGLGVAHYFNPDGNAVFQRSVTVAWDLYCNNTISAAGNVNAGLDLWAGRNVYASNVVYTPNIIGTQPNGDLVVWSLVVNRNAWQQDALWINGSVQINGDVSLNTPHMYGPWGGLNFYNGMIVHAGGGQWDALWTYGDIRCRTGYQGYGSVYSDNNMYAYAFINVSDARLKRDVSEWRDGLDIVRQLAPKQFHWVGGLHDDGLVRFHHGLEAQDVEALLPTAVHHTSDGIKHVEYSEITIALINAVKELAAKVEALEARGG